MCIGRTFGISRPSTADLIIILQVPRVWLKVDESKVFSHTLEQVLSDETRQMPGCTCGCPKGRPCGNIDALHQTDALQIEVFTPEVFAYM